MILMVLTMIVVLDKSLGGGGVEIGWRVSLIRGSLFALCLWHLDYQEGGASLEKAVVDGQQGPYLLAR